MSAKNPLLKLFAVVALLAIPLSLLGISFLVQDQFRDIRELRRLLDSSNAIKANLEDLLVEHLNVETGQRGFVIAADERFLAPYYEGENQLARTFAELDRAIAADPQLSRKYASIKQNSKAKSVFAAETIARARKGDLQGAQAAVAAGRGKQLMDAIRQDVSQLKNIEEARLKRMTRARDASRDQVESTIYGMLVGFAALLTFIGAIAALAIRDRQRALAQSHELAGRQQAILDGTVDGLLLLDERGFIVENNPSIERLFGFSTQELTGKHNTFLMANQPPLEASIAWLHHVGSAGRNKAGKRHEFTGKHKDGTILETDVAVSRIAGVEEKRYVAIIRDITERKRVEAMKTEFVSTVSHELRTPLTSIGGSLGLLAAGAVGPLNEKAARLVGIAHSNCERLIRLINDILDIEKIESGKMQFDLKRMKVAPMLDRVAAANAAFAAKHGVEILVNHAGWPQMIEGDADRLDQLLTNLLSNAIKHSPEGSRVEITALQDSNRVSIEVADRGGGVPEDFRDRIFGKFAMADGADNRARGGTGLGLSIAREIAVRHGGSISFSDRPGGGTIFRVDLPLVCETASRAKMSYADLPVILHIDDDLDCLDVVASAFEGKAALVSVVSLAEARAVIAERHFAAAIVDVSIDPDSGLDLLPDLRASQPGLPILLFTAFDASYSDANVEAIIVKSRQPVTELVATTLRLASGRLDRAA